MLRDTPQDNSLTPKYKWSVQEVEGWRCSDTFCKHGASLGEDYTQLDTTAKVAVLEPLVKKAAHARHGVEWKIFKEQTVNRKGKNCVGNAHREQLKAISTGSEISSLPKEALKKRDSKYYSDGGIAK
jgi:hypothetical protein